MADRKKKPKKKPDGRGQRPRDPNQFAPWIVEQSASQLPTGEQSPKYPKSYTYTPFGLCRHGGGVIAIAYSKPLVRLFGWTRPGRRT